MSTNSHSMKVIVLPKIGTARLTMWARDRPFGQIRHRPCLGPTLRMRGAPRAGRLCVPGRRDGSKPQGGPSARQYNNVRAGQFPPHAIIRPTAAPSAAISKPGASPQGEDSGD